MTVRVLDLNLAMRTIATYALLLLAIAPLAIGAAASDRASSVHATDAGAPHYPDIQTLEPTDIRITDEAGGRFLKLTNAVANLGDGPFELFPINNPDAQTTDAYQRVYTHDDLGEWSVYSETRIGTFEFHPFHNHWHFGGFAEYELWSKAEDGGIGDELMASSGKVSFCMIDGGVLDDDLEHYTGFRYFQCRADDPEGISVGYYDVYSYFLPGQSIDITGVPPGDYWLVSTADPDNYVMETNEDNNSAAVEVTITGPVLLTKGSADCDGDVDTIDALQVLRAVAGLSTTAKCLLDAGDVNCDAAVEALDAQFILRYVAGLPVNLPNGCPPIGTNV
jgi:hypothetical protein